MSLQNVEIPEATQHQESSQTLFTVRQFSETEPAFSESSLRALIFNAAPRHTSKKGVILGNGLLEGSAVVRRGRKILIHRERFLAWAVAK